MTRPTRAEKCRGRKKACGTKGEGIVARLRQASVIAPAGSIRMTVIDRVIDPPCASRRRFEGSPESGLYTGRSENEMNCAFVHARRLCIHDGRAIRYSLSLPSCVPCFPPPSIFLLPPPIIDISRGLNSSLKRGVSCRGQVYVYNPSSISPYSLCIFNWLRVAEEITRGGYFFLRRGTTRGSEKRSMRAARELIRALRIR